MRLRSNKAKANPATTGMIPLADIKKTAKTAQHNAWPDQQKPWKYKQGKPSKRQNIL